MQIQPVSLQQGSASVCFHRFQSRNTQLEHTTKRPTLDTTMWQPIGRQHRFPLLLLR